MLVRASSGSGGGGGASKLEKKTQTIAATTETITFSTLSNIQSVAGFSNNGMVYGYYDDSDSQYHYLSTWQIMMEVVSISGNQVTVRDSYTESFDFYAFGT